jgi:hypothetical protein
MNESLAQSLALIDVSGYLIIGAILLLLSLAIGLSVVLRARYAGIGSDLRANGKGTGSAFTSDVLNAISRDVMAAVRRASGEVNTQAIIEHNFQAELRGMLIGERFVKSSTGLMIILGLVGTFYGLTLSIGRLSALVSGNDATDASAITESLTAGLTQALTGMSVAFSTSLFGILAAVLMTLLSVFLNVADGRAAVMAQIEAYVDSVLLSGARPAGVASGSALSTGGAALDGMVAAFGQSVAQLDGSVQRFEAALVAFSTTTRDFREFNLHLKDNVQRLSLSFGELSDTMQDTARSLRERAPE